VAGPIFYVAVCLLGFALIQRRLATTPITGPMVFVALGLLAGSSALGIITTDSGDIVTVVNVLFQATLILVLFTDAAALHFTSWRKDAALPGSAARYRVAADDRGGRDPRSRPVH
jgi:NhaP-type Na+/H+ and K+/H+ antiporter